MAKILITGGAGFIGSNIAEIATKQGHFVRVLDNLSTGHLNNLVKEVEFVKGDITDPKIVRSAMEGIDFVLHYAAQASVVVSTENPQLDCNINVVGTVNILQQALKSHIKHVIFASTGGAIYGNVKHLPAPETTPKNPLSPYGVSKASAEYFCEYYKRRGLPVTILRFANVYGPKQDIRGEAGVISIFLGNIIAGKPLIVYGYGKPTRDYIFVKDLAKLNMMILDKPIPEVVNVGTGKEISLNELLEVIKEVTGKNWELEYKPLRSGEVERISLDVSKITELTDWKAETPLKIGIQEVWKWIQTSYV